LFAVEGVTELYENVVLTFGENDAFYGVFVFPTVASCLLLSQSLEVSLSMGGGVSADVL
jgi:hypothetical protein